jgi:hypothetical protein
LHRIKEITIKKTKKMETSHTFNETTELNKEETIGLTFIGTIYAVNNGSSYAADTFTEEEEAEEYAERINDKTGDDCYVVEVDVYQNEDEEYFYFHKD